MKYLITLILLVSNLLWASTELEYSFSRSSLSGLPQTSDGKFTVVDGDMIFSNSRSAAGKNSTLWKGGVLVYQIDPKFNSGRFRKVVLKAMGRISSKTNISFKKRTSERDYVFISAMDSGCYSQVGRVGGVQPLNLDLNGCLEVGIVVHELYHALGVFHEQSRYDRDRYIKILYENMIPQMSRNFDIIRHAGIGSYDFNSIMHYGSEAFSRNGRPTMVTHTNQLIRANRKSQTKRDINGLNELYKNEVSEKPPIPRKPDGKMLECHEEMNFSDSDTFEKDLAIILKKHTDKNVCIKFRDKLTKEELPQRINKWFSEIQKTGGKVEYVEVARGFLSWLLNLIFELLFGSEGIDYSMASEYNALIVVDKNSKVVMNVTFYRR